MADYQQLVKVKEDAEKRLRAIPGVHAVGISKKSVGGKPTDELAIAVFLVEKRPLERVLPEEVIPPEIDGFKTDVVEMQRPKLRMAANPNNLVATVSADGLTITFSGTKNPPGAGIVIVVDYSVTDDSSNTKHYVAEYETDPPDKQEDIADALAKGINARRKHTNVSASSDDETLTIDPFDDTYTCLITHCEVFAIDDKQYFDDHLRGGIQLQVGGAKAGYGTIGFLATTAVTAEDPQGKVVAVTCQHVVYSEEDQDTNLSVAVDQVNNIATFSIDDTDPIPLNSLVTVHFKELKATVFYSTVAGDTEHGVAAGVAAAVTQANLTGISATNPGGGVRVDFNIPDDETVTCDTYGPESIDPGVDLTATVIRTAVTFTGEVSGDNYGIFTSVNQGGLKATCGVFTHPASGDTLSSIAKAIADAFTKLPDNVRGAVTVSQVANTVTFDNAESVTCVVQSDIQVGQPDNSFGSPCSHCCSHRIGRVIDSKADVDVAVIQLDAGQKWLPEIEGEGMVSGIHSLEPTDLGIAVFKRGRTLPVSTPGTIEVLQMSGIVGGDGHDFDRQYVNAIKIKSEAANNGPFVLDGDSGAAVVDIANAVVGIIFSGDDLCGLVTPIDSIIDAFQSYDLNLAPAPAAGQAPGDIRTVPKPAMAMVADEQKRTAAPQPFLEKRLAQAEKEISATVEGAQYAELVKTHFVETQRLVNSNRRVATAWHRNGGPEILNAMLRMLQRHDEPMPDSINGKPFADCLERMRRVFARYASPALAADLPRFAECMKSFAGLTYPQMLATLQLRNGD